ATVEACIALSRRAAISMGMIPYYLYRQKYMTGNLENVGYTLPGRQCLYNIDMMEETHSIVAFGAGGISRRMDFSRSVHERLANPKGVPHYIERIDAAIEKKRVFFNNRTNRRK
ncbi:MAG: coproporphyrinogen dehydrogenase HemZ, partial [Christensenellales bacterium]